MYKNRRTARGLRCLAMLLVISLLCGIGAFAAEYEQETAPAAVKTTTAAVFSDLIGSYQQLEIQSYLTSQTIETATVKPCDIIFVLDQSRWINGSKGENRAKIIEAMNTMMRTLETPTDGGEHRVAIAGYGRVNVGSDSGYSSAEYPGKKHSGASLNTGYYKADGSFVSQAGWTEATNLNSGDLPAMSEAYRDTITYDSAFMSLTEAESVLTSENMVAWYADASRMDAGLTLAEQMAEVAKAAAAANQEDRNLIVCVVASSLPIQKGGSYLIRDQAVQVAAENLRNQGATILTLGEYHKYQQILEGDTEEHFHEVMTGICGSADTQEADKGNYYFSLSKSGSITNALNGLIRQITVTVADGAVQQTTVTIGTVTDITQAASQTDADQAAWEKWLEKIQTDTWVQVDYYRFESYDETGNPVFEQEPYSSHQVQLKDMMKDGTFGYQTQLFPLQPNLAREGAEKVSLMNGNKVVITIRNPLAVNYHWSGEVPQDASLPDTEYVSYGESFDTPSMSTSDLHYQFEGWYTDLQCTNEVTGEVVLREEMDLYGKWNARYVVSYHWQKPMSEADSHEQVAPGAQAKLFTPVQNGYIFGGWYTDPSCSDDSVFDPTTAICEDMDLYAKWTPETPLGPVTIQYVSYQVKHYQQTESGDYEEIHTETLKAKPDDTVKATTSDRISADYVLNTAKSICEGVAYTPTVDENGNIQMLVLELYYDLRRATDATETYYTLSYETNGGTVYDSERYLSGSQVSLSKVPAWEGYRFTGWYADEALTEAIDSVSMTVNRTVYAGWSASSVPELLNGEDHFAYIVGYVDGTVRPDGNITRAEAATVFFRLLKDEVRDGNLTSENTFMDVAESAWYCKAVSTLAALGIVQGRTDTTFAPNEPITRAELAAICARFDTGLTDGNSDFVDIQGHWAQAEIQRAAALGWVQGCGDGTFRPDDYVTRAEAITMINRVLCRIPEEEGDLLEDMNTWPDNGDTTKWYYLAIQEATNSHGYEEKSVVNETWNQMMTDPDWKRYER